MEVKELPGGYYVVVESLEEKRRRYTPDPRAIKVLADRVNDVTVKARLMEVASNFESLPVAEPARAPVQVRGR